MTRPMLRGALATLAGATVAWACWLIQLAPGMLSPSEPPSTLSYFALELPFELAVFALVLALWLLPGCAVTRFIASSRGVRGIRAAVMIGGIAAVVAFGTLYFLPSLFEWPPTRPQVLRKLPIALLGATFVLTWFLAFELLPPRAGSAQAEGTTTVHPRPLSQLAIRTPAETLAIVAVVAYAAILGGIAGGILDFGGDGEWLHQSSVLSPRGDWRADIVVYLEPGGALSGMASEVYLLPASKAWSPRHRGLLIWRARSTEVDGVVWDSDQRIRVRAAMGTNDTYFSVQRHAHSFARSGFAAQTEVVPGK